MNGARGKALAGLLPKSVMHCCARSCSLQRTLPKKQRSFNELRHLNTKLRTRGSWVQLLPGAPNQRLTSVKCARLLCCGTLAGPFIHRCGASFAMRSTVRVSSRFSIRFALLSSRPTSALA